MLLLFDIDGTLLTTKRSGVKALEDAGRELFGGAFTIEGVDFAGRLDPLIIGELLRRNGVDESRANADAMRAGYGRHLPRLLAPAGVATACPGVHEVLGLLRRVRGITLGLLTGNFAETGTIKLRAVGIDPDWFAVRVWGDESPVEPPAREHLPPVGMRRYHELNGNAVAPERVVVIGDTPHDVSCAQAHGCRSLGVGTGVFTSEQLTGCGATRAVPSMADAAGVVDWLTSGADER